MKDGTTTIPSRSSRSKAFSSGKTPLRLQSFFTSVGGNSYKNGLYRIMHSHMSRRWNAHIANAFPEYRGRVAAFGYDWLGRVFATDARRLEGGLPGVVMLEPGTAEVLEIPANLESFHDEELVEHAEEALAATFHEQWIKSGHAAPKPAQCAGYSKPLFLGGEDAVDNLELSDMDVYWTLATQLIRKTKGLPVGTPITSVTSDD